MSIISLRFYKNCLNFFSKSKSKFNLPDISSSSLMRSLSISGGSLLEKKSFRAVATAFTGISKECMSTLPSVC